jgi:hypothetical protein
MCSSAQSQHKKCETNDQSGKKHKYGQEQKHAAERYFRIVKEQVTAPLLGLRDFRTAIRANVPDPIANTDSHVALHRGHSDLVVKYLIAFRTGCLHVREYSK